MVAMSSQLRTLLLAEAERARSAVEAATCSIGHWDRGPDRLVVLVNAGHLGAGYDRFPEHETYPLDSFPAVAALLREGRAYRDPTDVSSMALTAQMQYVTHAAVPIPVEGETWGELWVCRRRAGSPFTAADVDRLTLAAARLGEALAPYV